jgi:hypothetical protein
VRLDRAAPDLQRLLQRPGSGVSASGVHHLYGLPAQYFGLFEDNDPSRRLMAIANYNTNLAEYWQMAGAGFFPIEQGNEAFKLGINYIVYALTTEP